MKISLKNIASLLVSSLISLAMLFYAHQGLEAEIARPNRSLIVLAGWAGLGVLGLLVAPTIRDRIVPAARTGFTLVRLGRRAYDGQAITADLELPPPEAKP
jgi:hypothetical protein